MDTTHLVDGMSTARRRSLGVWVAVLGLLCVLLPPHAVSVAGALSTPAAAIMEMPALTPLQTSRQGAAHLILTGHLRDATTGKPIMNGLVSAGGLGTLSNAQGVYHLAVPRSQARPASLLIIAGGYLPLAQKVPARGTTVTTAALQPLSTLTAVLEGAVRDAQSNAAIAGAAVGSPAHVAIADDTGHYALTLPGGRQLLLTSSAHGYTWGVPCMIASDNNQMISGGPIAFDVSGVCGLQSTWSNPAVGATLTALPQVVPATTHALTFTGQSTTGIESAFAVTYPDGLADFLPLTLRGNRFTGVVRFTHGQGIYQIEINNNTGFADFNLPVYVGVPYTPRPPVSLYTPDSASASLAQMEGLALAALNALRVHYKVAPLHMSVALQDEAHQHSVDIVVHNYYNQHPHVGSDGSTFLQRVAATGAKVRLVGEDIANDTSVLSAINGLMNSPGHRVNILNPSYSEVGIGIARQSDLTEVLTIDFVQLAGS